MHVIVFVLFPGTAAGASAPNPDDSLPGAQSRRGSAPEQFIRRSLSGGGPSTLGDAVRVDFKREFANLNPLRLFRRRSVDSEDAATDSPLVDSSLSQSSEYVLHCR